MKESFAYRKNKAAGNEIPQFPAFFVKKCWCGRFFDLGVGLFGGFIVI